MINILGKYKNKLAARTILILAMLLAACGGKSATTTALEALAGTEVDGVTATDASADPIIGSWITEPLTPVESEFFPFIPSYFDFFEDGTGELSVSGAIRSGPWERQADGRITFTTISGNPSAPFATTLLDDGSILHLYHEEDGVLIKLIRR